MYDRKLGNRVLTFRVSGQLWNRSLVMMDDETESLWSHLLGEAMQGQLKGTSLTAIPSEMTTWEAWRGEHPDTTVLAMTRTRAGYTREFHTRDPGHFVLGFRGKSQMHHCSFETLKHHSLLNVDANGLGLLVLYDPTGTSARVFESSVAGQQLTFAAEEQRLRDHQTGSIWDRARGTAIDGPLKGETLRPHVGIVSYAKSWLTFHPGSREVVGP